jgi:hypothetical protein
MATGKPLTIYAYLGDAWCYTFRPNQASRVDDRLDLVRQNYYTLRVQAVRTTDFSLDANGKPANANTVDLSAYSDAIFGFKTTDTATDFTAAWRGYNTTDTAWHNLSYGRFSIDVAPISTLTVAQYRAAFRLLNGTSYLDIPDFSLLLNLRQNLITGTEPTTPSGGVDPNSYTGTVLAGASSVVITVPNMTTTGQAVPFFLGSPVSTIGATCGVGIVTVELGGTVDANTLVGLYIVKKS